MGSNDNPMNSVTDTLARWIVDAAYSDIPRNVRDEATRTLLNWLGCAVSGGPHEDATEAMIAKTRRIESAADASVLLALSTPNRFEPDIRAFEERDRADPPAEGGILFVGSSSIRLWKSFDEDFAGIDACRRGFGGARFTDVLHFLDRIVIPYRPRQVIVYAGSLDLHGGGASPEAVLGHFQEFVRRIHAVLPETRIGYISMKPSLSKWADIQLDREANERIAEWSRGQDRVDFIDIWSAMAPGSEPPSDALFVADRNHLSREGYAVWAEAIRPFLR